MYVKIIDKGECFSTTMEFIDGVYANKDEWAKHNFYPKNGMVGEVVKRTPSAYIVKIMDGIYVPMTARGIKEISSAEYQTGQRNNVCDGMDERQKSINDRTDAIIGDSWRHLPDMRPEFEVDIIQNMKILTRDFERNIFLPDLEESAVMYAVDMCLEFRLKSGRELDPTTVGEITNQVIDVYKKYFSVDFLLESQQRCADRVARLVSIPSYARTVVDNYYSKVNSRY